MSQTNGTFSSHFLQFQYFIGSCVFCLPVAMQLHINRILIWLQVSVLSAQNKPTLPGSSPGPAFMLHLPQRTTSTRVSMYQLDKLVFLTSSPAKLPLVYTQTSQPQGLTSALKSHSLEVLPKLTDSSRFVLPSEFSHQGPPQICSHAKPPPGHCQLSG